MDRWIVDRVGAGVVRLRPLLRHQIGDRAGGQRHLALDGDSLRPDCEETEQRHRHRRDKGGLDRGDTPVVAKPSPQGLRSRTVIAFPKPYGSFWNTCVEVRSSVPFDISPKNRPSGPATTGHWYITLRISSCPFVPGL